MAHFLDDKPPFIKNELGLPNSNSALEEKSPLDEIIEELQGKKKEPKVVVKEKIVYKERENYTLEGVLLSVISMKEDACFGDKFKALSVLETQVKQAMRVKDDW